MQTQSVENIFAQSWALFTRNPVIIVPGLVIGIVLGIVNSLFTPTTPIDPTAPGATALLVSRAGAAFVSLLISAFAYIATVTITTGIAGTAWERGTATLGDGTMAFKRDWGNVALAALYMFVIYVVAVAIAVPTLFISIIAAVIFLFYALPAAVIGERPGGRAIAESFAIAKRRFLPTLMIVVLILVLGLVVGFIAGALRIAPVVGPLFSAVVLQMLWGYAALVAVGEYRNFRAAGDARIS